MILALRFVSAADDMTCDAMESCVARFFFDDGDIPRAAGSCGDDVCAGGQWADG